MRQTDGLQGFGDFLMSMAREMHHATVREELSVGPFTLPMSPEQEEAGRTFWTSARALGYDVERVVDERANTITFTAYRRREVAT